MDLCVRQAQIGKRESFIDQREDGLAGWKKAVNRTLHWVEKEPAKAKATAGRSKKK